MRNNWCDSPGNGASNGAAAAAGAAPVVDDSDDSSPLPITRGNWAGFLPAGTVADLNASAAAGCGLAFMPGAAAPQTNRLINTLVLITTVVTLYHVLTRRSR